MYGAICRKILFPLYETALMKRNTMRYLDELEKNQWLNRSRIEDIQWKKLKRLLTHCRENVPFYRERFKAAGFDPERMTSMEDFKRIPVLTREDISDSGESMLVENRGDHGLLSKSTSGSTGVPLKFKYDRDAYEWHMAALARSNRWAGWDFGETEVYIWGVPPYKRTASRRIKEALHHMVIRRKKIDTFSLNDENMEKKIREINAFRPRVVIGYTSAIYELARFARSRRLRCHSPQGVVTTAEKLYPHQRSMIEDAFGARVYDRYGCQEAMMLAGECDAHNGLHMNIDNYVIEILKDGTEAPAGESGEIVFTDLNNYSMPFIRYKNGDLAAKSYEKMRLWQGAAIA